MVPVLPGVTNEALTSATVPVRGLPEQRGSCNVTVKVATLSGASFSTVTVGGTGVVRAKAGDEMIEAAPTVTTPPATNLVNASRRSTVSPP
jgi:hypothetical protein